MAADLGLEASTGDSSGSWVVVAVEEAEEERGAVVEEGAGSPSVGAEPVVIRTIRTIGMNFQTVADGCLFPAGVLHPVPPSSSCTLRQS